jgi:hypothetical protein
MKSMSIDDDAVGSGPGDLAARVEAAESRIAALERAMGWPTSLPGTDVVARAGSTEMPGDQQDDPLWMLHALERRIGEHSAVVLTGSVSLRGGPRIEWQQGLEVGRLLDADWDGAAAPLRALGHAVRLRLLRDVLEGRDTAADLVGAEGEGTTGQTYHHLRQLVAAGWLRSPGRGRYEVPPPRVVPLLAVLLAAQP